MKLLRSFPLLAYALSLLSIVSFCVATGQITLLLVAGLLASVSWYMTGGPRGFAIPHWVANLLIIAASAAMVPDLVSNRAEVIAVLGRFAVWLLLIKLYEQKSRRDYAQMLTLTSVLMLTGMLDSRSLLFGVALLIYSVFGLYVLLVYRLYVSNDVARLERTSSAPQGMRLVPPMRPVVGRGVHGQLVSTALGVSFFGLVVSILVFLAFPRGLGAGMVQRLIQGDQRQSRMNDEVDLLTSAGTRITDDRSPLMEVRVRNAQGDPIQVEYGLYLRGTALDTYDPRRHVWVEGESSTDRTTTGTTSGSIDEFAPVGSFPTNRIAAPAIDDAWTIHVDPILPMGSRVYSTLWPVAVASDLQQEFAFDERSQTLQLPANESSAAPYAVKSNPFPSDDARRALTGGSAASLVVRHRYENARVEMLAKEILRSAGLPLSVPRDYPERGRYVRRVSTALVDWFRTQGFRYTLDLSEMRVDGDPIESFLFDARAGHCEFYAASMTAMLQSLDIDARLVTGFLVSEHQGDGRYLARASHAHAWVEARTDQIGWSTFDPTPPADIEAFRGDEATLARRVENIYEMIEVEWMQQVVSFNSATQAQMQESMHLESLAWIDDVIAGVDDWVAEVYDRFGFAGALQIVVVSAAIVVGVLVVIQLIRRGRRIRRTLRLEHLHGREYRRMVQQLGFYIDMLDLLRRAGIEKPTWQPPLAFADGLADHGDEVRAPVRDVASYFYSARYGGRTLSAQDREQLHATLNRLAQALGVRRKRSV